MNDGRGVLCRVAELKRAIEGGGNLSEGGIGYCIASSGCGEHWRIKLNNDAFVNSKILESAERKQVAAVPT
jgi:hypothetical protein